MDLKSRVVVSATCAYPEVAELNERGQYSCLFIVPKDSDDLQPLRQLLRFHIQSKFQQPTLPPGAFDPLRDADEMDQASGQYKFKPQPFRGGNVVFRAKSRYDVPVFDGEDRQLVHDKRILRGGDPVLVELSAYAYSNQSQGVALSLASIWRIGAGDVLIEKGGSAGSAFAHYDTAKIRFPSAGGNNASTEAFDL